LIIVYCNINGILTKKFGIFKTRVSAILLSLSGSWHSAAISYSSSQFQKYQHERTFW